MAVEVGSVLTGKVTGITNFGAFVELPDGSTGMVHISEVSASYIKDIHEKLSEGDEVNVKVLDIKNGKVSLSIKRALPESEQAPARPQHDRPPRGAGRQSSRPNVWTGQQKQETADMSFEDMMARFKAVSDEKMSDIKRSNVQKRGAGIQKRGGGNSRP